MTDLIYHIVAARDWAPWADKPAYEPASLATEGFIHLATDGQVAGVRERYYRDVPDLLRLHVDPAKLTHELAYEVATDGERFPHLYGPLNREAVVRVEEMAPKGQR